MRDVLPPSDLNPLLLLLEARIDTGDGAGGRAEAGAASEAEVDRAGGGGGRGDWGGGDCGGTGRGGDVALLPRWMINDAGCGRCGSCGLRRGANMSSALKRNCEVVRGRTGSARLRLRLLVPRRLPLLPLPALGERAALLMRFTRPDTLARSRLLRLFRLLRDGAREDGEDGGQEAGSGGGGGGGGGGGTGDVVGCALCCCCCCGLAESKGVSGNLDDIGVMAVVASVVADMGQIDTTPPAAFNGVEESSGDVMGSWSSGSVDTCLPSMSRRVRDAMRCFTHRLYRGRKKNMSSMQAENTTGGTMVAASMELRELLWF